MYGMMPPCNIQVSLMEIIMYAFLDPKHRGQAGGERGRAVTHRLGLFDKVRQGQGQWQGLCPFSGEIN